MLKRITLLTYALVISVITGAQPPSGYYSTAEGLTGAALQQALHDIIDGHTVRTYADLWTCFKTTDTRADGVTIWDIYTDIPTGTPVYVFTYSTDQCGNYSGEGDCYNREHSFPKSWFGGEVSPMYTDLFHLYPTDGWVNNKRGNYPFGEVDNADYVSSNGSRLGVCTWPGYAGVVFEPIDAYKGDLARTYFYMATRYYGEDSSWPGSDMVTGSQPKEWAMSMLLTWHRNDPVSTKEINRNNEVYKYQNNRNPFIDDPLYVEKIWGTLNTTGETADDLRASIYPNPSGDIINIRVTGADCSSYDVEIFDLRGCLVMFERGTGDIWTQDISGLENGLYIVRVRCGRATVTGMFMKISE